MTSTIDTATLDAPAPALASDTTEFEAEFATPTEVSTSTRESRAAVRAEMTKAEQGQFKHGFTWLVIGLVISMAGFGFVAMRDVQSTHAATSQSSSTTP